MKSPLYNSEGYADPTAFHGMQTLVKEEADADRRVGELVKVLKYIINLAGFELAERVQLRDKKTGRRYM